jgi:phytoene dehydrogenase-like protein
VSDSYDAVVVGAGPNGLVAALQLARNGWHVLVVEAEDTVGGGTRTQELTLPGHRHDVCSAIHPLGIASPAFRQLARTGRSLEDAGVRWIHPEIPLGHGLAPGRSALLHRDLGATADGLGDDGRAWRRLFGPMVRSGFDLVDALLSPLPVPSHPFALARFGLPGIRSASSLGRSRFRGDEAPALLAGLSAHSVLPLDAPITAGLGMLLGGLAHLVGWPMAEGGSQSIADALVRLIEDEGGEVRTSWRVRDLEELPPSRAVLCDVVPRSLVELTGDRLPERYRRRLLGFRHGPGVCKVDWVLDGPVPWADPVLHRAGTVHLGGTLADVRRSEGDVMAGRHPEDPFLLLAQQSRFDPTRLPETVPGADPDEGPQILWGYCHVPHGSDVDMTERIEARIERFAPGFRDRIVARRTMTATEVAEHHLNYPGGDITGGVTDLVQFLARPVLSPTPWATPLDGLYLCSSSTPPGGGVHGMCGLHAANLAMRRAG